MCCFTGPVEVAETNIFARAAESLRQLLVYEATTVASAEVAMVLPLPVPPGSGEGAVEFVDLQRFPELFAALADGFPARPVRRGPPFAKGAPEVPPGPLRVVGVGSFEASFVPTVDDFARLDPRFRMDPSVWEALPDYRTWGFAVFRLAAGANRTHPMAFVFPRRDPTRLFFPTVHVHDGLVHDYASFDHALYCQETRGSQLALGAFEESRGPARRFVDPERGAGIVDPDRHVYRLELRGPAHNVDVFA